MSLIVVFIALGSMALIVGMRRIIEHLSRHDDNGESRARRRNLEPRIFQLAHRLHGSLTVSDVVIETGATASEVEQLLQSLVDNNRVRMEVRDDGLIFYEFPEIIARYRREIE